MAGLHVSPGSLVFYVVTVATVVSALVLPVVGALADRSPRKKLLMASFAWTGSGFACAMFLVTGTDWQLGAAAALPGEHLSRVEPGDLRLDPVRHRLCPMSATRCRRAAGPWAIWVAACCWPSTWWSFACTGRSGSTRRLRSGSACSAPGCGGRSSRSSLTAESATGAPVDRLREPGGSGAAELRPALGDAARDARLPDDPAVPGGLPVLQRRHPDRDHGRLDVRGEAARVLHVRADRDHPAGAVRRVRRRAAVRSARGPVGHPSHDHVGTGGLDGDCRHSVRAAGPSAAAVPRSCGRHRHSCSAAPRRSPAPSSASSSRAVERPSTSASTRPCERGTSWLGTLVFGLVHQVTGSYRPAIFALVAFFAVGIVLLSRVDTRRGDRRGRQHPGDSRGHPRVCRAPNNLWKVTGASQRESQSARESLLKETR